VTEHDDQFRPANPRKGLRKGIYLIPSLFTGANVLMGFFSVMGSIRGFQYVGLGSQHGVDAAAPFFDRAAIAIGWAVLFDALDGRIARMTRTTTEIGVQLDSIADVVTFGIAPTVLAYCWGYGSALTDGTNGHKLGWFISFMYLMCGAFRLARFNVQATRPRVLAEGATKTDKKSFVGLPIPAAAAILAAIVHFSPRPLVSYPEASSIWYSGLLIALVGVLGALMVSSIRYSSFKTVGTKRRSTRMVILLVAALGMLIWLYSRYMLLLLAVIYATHGLLSRAWGLVRRRPDPEPATQENHEPV
jgi:CDP-diacylglycerol--serine O-phosphatidyltransferase